MSHLDNIIGTVCLLWKTFCTPLIWLSFSSISVFINQHIFSEWNFAIGFFVAFFCDTLAGIYVSWRKKEYSTKILRDKMMDKLVVYFTVIVCYSSVTKITISNSSNILIYADGAFYAILATTEFVSVLRNWYRYKKWPFLKKIMTHFNIQE